MRILMLNSEFPPLGAGAGNANYYLLKELSKEKKLKIDLITASIDFFKTEQFSKNIRIFFVDISKSSNLKKQSPWDLLRYYFRASKLVGKLIKQNRYNLVHAFFTLPAGYIAFKSGLPYIISLRGSDVPGHNPKMKFEYFIFKFLIKNIWRDAKKVVANSLNLRETARLTAPNLHINIIENGLDLEKFRYNPLAAGHQNKNKVKFLFVGRLHEVKGIKYLLVAFDRFSKDKPDVELTIIGDGPLNYALRKQYRQNDKIIFLGMIEQNKLIHFYRDSDIYLSPSINEGMSNALLEAMAQNLAIISTDTGGAGRFGGAAFFTLVGKKNIKQLVEAMENYYSISSLIRKERKSIDRSDLIPSWGKVAGEYLDLYRDVSENFVQ